MTVPAICHDCRSLNVRPHCTSSTCPWVRCASCQSVSGIAYGERNYIPGPGREPKQA